MTEEDMKAALQAYIDGFVAGDAEAISSLFADAAQIEDPVGGGGLVDGIEAIRDFYRQSVSYVTHMELAAPVRASHGNAAAMAFDVQMNVEGQTVRTSVIDVMEFDGAGKVRRMRAYWGPSDSRVVGTA